jgi:Flp pilus assembly protein TadG
MAFKRACAVRFRLPLKVFSDKRGNVAIYAALCILPLTLGVGMAMDLSNATRVRLALQDATDSAALAIAKNNATITDVNAAAKNYVTASYNNNSSFTISTATLDKTTLTVTVSASASVPTNFAGILGKSAITVNAYSVVKGQGADYEIALALDNSGSMGDTAGSGNAKIDELKSATKALFDAMFIAANTGHVKIGVVPFAASVNVGTANKTATWLDTGGLASYAEENFDSSSARRMSLFDSTKGGMKNTAWAGCVETRPIKSGATIVDYDANDTAPSTVKPDTLFEPWFAPDEPDGDNYKSSGSGQYDYRLGSYYNDYLNDEAGGCTGNDTLVKATDAAKQARTCKYKGVTPDTSNGMGPNYMCTTTGITPLTPTRATLDSAVSAMEPDGNTNILEGMMWAWRVLSPGAPFTEGAPYGTKNLNKVVILMSDGENNYPGINNMNHSYYFSYGYSGDGRIGSTSSNTSTLIAALDVRTKLACDNAKAAGIIIYTVALGTGANTSLLGYCASKPTYAYAPVNGSDLTSTFQTIAASINKLRIAQ